MRAVYLRTGVIAALICVQTVSAIAAWSVLSNLRGEQGIPRGIKINGVQVGGLTGPQAETLLEETFSDGLNKTLTIQAGEHSIQISPESVEAKLDYPNAVKQALALKEQTPGLPGSLMELALLAGFHNIALPLNFNREQMVNQLTVLKNLTDQEPRNATLIGDANRRILVPERTGRYLDIDATLEKLNAMRPPLPGTVQAVVVPAKATVTAGDLEPLRSILGECVTELNPAQANRTTNVALALSSLHDTLIKPGEVFSFNEQVGARTAGNGYKNAPVIDGSMTVQGLGGGVCQVSTTLYNALLTANLEIVERQPHTRPVGYVSPGLDATVADGQIDLRFRNNRNFPVYITGSLADDTLTVRLWGVTSDNEPRIDIDTDIQTVNPKTLIHTDPNLPAGSQVVKNPGRQGYIARVYQVVKNNYGENRQLITRDYYPPEDKVIIVGAGGPPQEK